MKPQLNLLYYDANCRFCSALVRLLRKADRAGVLDLRAGMDDDVRQAGLVEADLRRSAYLITQDGQAYEGFFAFRQLGLLLPLLRPLALLMWFPGSHLLGARVYRWVADHRVGLFGCNWGS